MPRTMKSIVPDTPPLAIGTRTQWGRIQAVGVLGGRLRERYYWMIDKHGSDDASQRGRVPANASHARRPFYAGGESKNVNFIFRWGGVA